MSARRNEMPKETAVGPVTALPKLMTVSELASMLRKRPAAIRAAARRGLIAYYRVGKSQLFASCDVDAYLARNRQEARRVG